MPLNQMDGLSWVKPEGTSLLDLGCNVGELLGAAASLYPHLQLAGVDVNQAAIETARRNVPQADLHQRDGPRLPFADDSFDYVTCIEVIEHIPAAMRRATIEEVWRVLGRAADSFCAARTPASFRASTPTTCASASRGCIDRSSRRGRRDDGYSADSDGVVWHEHFSRDELLDLIGSRFEVETTRYGGLILLPIGDLLRWPFYRLNRHQNPVLRMIDRVMAWDPGSITAAVRSRFCWSCANRRTESSS